MHIEIYGNVNFCLDDKEPRYKTYSVDGLWKPDDGITTVRWSADGEFFKSQGGLDFIDLCRSIQGRDYLLLTKLLKENGFTLDAHVSFQELDMIKALANVFLWIETYFASDYDLETDPFAPRLFDDFTLDANNRLGIQKDIYFLKKVYSSPKYEIVIQNLMDINLLTFLKVSNETSVFENHFIPFIKPGYKSDFFKDTETQNFWKTLLAERDIRIRKTIKNMRP